MSRLPKASSSVPRACWGEAAELAEDVELRFLGHARQFGGAGRREDDLEWLHFGGGLRVEG